MHCACMRGTQPLHTHPSLPWCARVLARLLARLRACTDTHTHTLTLAHARMHPRPHRLAFSLRPCAPPPLPSPDPWRVPKAHQATACACAFAGRYHSACPDTKAPPLPSSKQSSGKKRPCPCQSTTASPSPFSKSKESNRKRRPRPGSLPLSLSKLQAKQQRGETMSRQTYNNLPLPCLHAFSQDTHPRPPD